MKYIKLFEEYGNKENIELFADDDWDEEEDFVERSHRDIPGMPYPDEFDDKDYMRIHNLRARSNSHDHLLRLSMTMANRITHIDKAVRRGNAALYYGLQDVADIFYNRAKLLYFGENESYLDEQFRELEMIEERYKL